MATGADITTMYSRSPSPTPTPPTASAPGPRATALQKLYADAISHILKTCSYDNFSACFPTPARQVPGSLRLLHQQFTEKLGESMRREFDNILADRKVVPALNELDRLIDEAKRRKVQAQQEGADAPVPPHTLPAHQLYLSHLAPSLAQHDETLRERQDAVQEENVELLDRVMRQRRDIADLVAGLENVVADLDASVATLNAPHADVEGLREEVRDVDTDMRMAT